MNAPLRVSPSLQLIERLERTQWWPLERLERVQLRRLDEVLRHARDTVPFYRGRLDGVDSPLSAESWRAVPILTRRDIQDHAESLLSTRIPERVGGQYPKHSSGSTSEPVRVIRTALEQIYWQAITARDHLWHQRDFNGTLCAIRAIAVNGGTLQREVVRTGWGARSGPLASKGKFAMLPISVDPRRQAEWLVKHDPHYLLTYPSNLRALLEVFQQQDLRLGRLREVRTVGETLTPELAEQTRAAWSVAVNDLYSTQEVGIVALHCPSGSGLYHIQSEGVKVEILDEQGRPCAPGVAGRVVVSNLHNFAMPLLRYDLGDYAEAGEPCPCGRGLPTLKRILGRSRNMLVLPNGERQWPFSGVYEYRNIAPIRRAQMIQLDRERIEMRLVADRPVTADEERRLTEVICRWIGHPFKVQYTYLDDFPRKANGKFEDFITMVAH
jgi:phenylacetate-CoA ligase